MNVDTVDTMTLWGSHEIGQRLGLGRTQTFRIVTSPDFPASFADLAMGRVWKTEDVEAWIDEYRPESSLNPAIRASAEYAQAA